MKFIKQEAISYDDICILPSYSDLNSRADADISFWPYRNPIVNSPMIHTSSKAMIKYMVENNMLTTVHRYFKSADEQLQWVKDSINEKFDLVYFAVGKDKKWIDTLIKTGVNKFCCDFAHGNSKVCVETVEYINKNCEESIIMAGNVGDYDGYKRLRKAGASIIRVGIASGGICSTNINTGVGVAIITSVLDCKKAKDELGGYIVCDGGITNGGRIAKAIACGADFIMLGGLLASTDLAEGPFYDNNMNLVDETNTTPAFVEYFGMASSKARKHNGTHSVENSIEGVSGLHEYKGRTDDLIRGLEANMRASMSYIGTRTWQNFKRDVRIQRVSLSGQYEKMTHLSKHD